MSLKGRIQPDHIPANKYLLQFIGLPPIDFISVAGLEIETDAIDLPDRTTASGGQSGTGELVVQVPTHHSIQLIAMDLWVREGIDPISSTYKKSGVLIKISGTGVLRRTWEITGCWAQRTKLMDVSFENEGELDIGEYTLKCDDIVRLT